MEAGVHVGVAQTTLHKVVRAGVVELDMKLGAHEVVFQVLNNFGLMVLMTSSK